MAIRLDANGDELSATTALNANGPWTICMWARAEGDGASTFTGLLWVGEGDSSSIGFGETSGGGNNDLHAMGGNGVGWASASNMYANFFSGSNQGTWVFICLKVEGQVSGYMDVDWLMRAEDAASLTTFTDVDGYYQGWDENLTIGDSPFGSDWFDGNLAHLKAWDVELSTEEVLIESRYALPQTNLDSVATFIPLRDSTDTNNLWQSTTGFNLTTAGTLTTDAVMPPIPWSPPAPRLWVPVAAGGGAQAITGTTFTPGATFPTGALDTQADLTGTLLSTGVTFPTGTLDTQADLTGTLLSVGVTFPTGTLDTQTDLTGTLLSVGVTFPAGTLTFDYPLTGTLLSAGATFPLGTLTQEGGAQAITGTLLSTGVTFPAGTLDTQADLTGALLSVGATFPAGTLDTQTDLAGTLLSTGVTFPTGTLDTQADLTGALLGVGVTFPLGTLVQEGGTQAISGQLLSTGVTFPAGTLVFDQVLTGTLLSVGATFPPGTITVAVEGLFIYTGPTYNGQPEPSRILIIDPSPYNRFHFGGTSTMYKTVLVTNGVYTAHVKPTLDQIADADVVYYGGHEYTVDAATKAAIEASGVGGDFVSA